MLAQTVTFQVKTTDFQRYSRQMSLADPSDRQPHMEEAALLVAERLLTAPDGLFAAGI